MRRAAPWLAALALVVVLVIGVVQAGGGSSETSSDESPSLSDMKRDLAGAPGPLAALHGRAATLETGGGETAYRRELRQLEGYPVVVNAWGSWCGPCKLEFPIFARVATKLGKRVAFVGLNVNDNNEQARAFLGKSPVPYPSFEDGNSRIVQQEGAIGGLPVTIFYDKNGKRMFTHQGGYKNDADLEADIRRYAGA
jgi:thiol-disulfide isomerase/thioredoxin